MLLYVSQLLLGHLHCVFSPPWLTMGATMIGNSMNRDGPPRHEVAIVAR